jgi:hypothetical protein
MKNRQTWILKHNTHQSVFPRQNSSQEFPRHITNMSSEKKCAEKKLQLIKFSHEIDTNGKTTRIANPP